MRKSLWYILTRDRKIFVPVELTLPEMIDLLNAIRTNPVVNTGGTPLGAFFRNSRKMAIANLETRIEECIGDTRSTSQVRMTWGRWSVLASSMHVLQHAPDAMEKYVDSLETVVGKENADTHITRALLAKVRSGDVLV